MNYYILCAGVITGLTFSHAAQAQDTNHDHHDHMNHPAGLSISGGHEGHVHTSITPASIMGDHLHEKGGWMLSYRFMRMEMKDNRDGTDDLSPLQISGDFANVTGVGPATLRIVPTEMTMDMHMVGAMYAPTDRLTLMAMAHYIDKEMDHLTFSAADPNLQIGEFTTHSEGFGDTKISALYGLYQKGIHQVVAKAGLSLPTGATDEEGDILNPLGVTQRVRLPYAMQLGSGTYDLEPGLTYSAHKDKVGWGLQYNAQIRLGDNDEDYTLGDRHVMHAWAGYQWNDLFQTTARLSAERESHIDGNDANIAGPVQTANPDNYGGDRIEAGFGFKLSNEDLARRGHSFGAEVTIPLYQDLNGPQLKRDYGFLMGYSYSF